MRTLVTFILRLWVDPQAGIPGWEGQVECLASNERIHIRGLQDLARFIEIQTSTSSQNDLEQRKEPGK